jgi:hypothetical protein
MAMTPCERCGACSWHGSDPNPTCPFCFKSMRRGTREEMAKQIHDLREVCLNAAGYFAGMSILTPDALIARLKEVLKETE